MKHPISAEDITESIAEALQYISFYHSEDFIKSMVLAYNREESKPAKAAIEQILINSRMSAYGRRPLCQDTGIVNVFVKFGVNAQLEKGCDIEQAINQGVRLGYTGFSENVLRASVLEDPIFTRKNTKDNTPAVIHTQLVPGNSIEFTIAAKGGGSENKSKFVVLNPSDNIEDWVLRTIPSMGAGWCPPGVIALGVGGTAEKSMLMAKEALMDPLDMHELLAKGAQNKIEEMRIRLYHKINALGIGAQGLGGLTTVLDVKIKEYPTHAASLPVALIPNCAATRHTHFRLEGSGKASFTPPDLSLWPNLQLDLDSGDFKKVDLQKLSQEEIETWRAGDTLLITGTIVTGRDAAHKKLMEIFESSGHLPEGLNMHNRLIYYVGPVDAVGQEAVGPAGPTTSTRMDKFSKTMLEKTTLLGMIGKAERGAETTQLLKAHKKVYLIAVGGAAYLVSKAIRKAKVVAFPELGMEAMHEFEVENMPVSVAVDTNGESVHISGPKKWSGIIAQSRSSS